MIVVKKIHGEEKNQRMSRKYEREEWRTNLKSYLRRGRS
jgi:hypothetical protein